MINQWWWRQRTYTDCAAPFTPCSQTTLGSILSSTTAPIISSSTFPEFSNMATELESLTTRLLHNGESFVRAFRGRSEIWEVSEALSDQEALRRFKIYGQRAMQKRQWEYGVRENAPWQFLPSMVVWESFKWQIAVEV